MPSIGSSSGSHSRQEHGEEVKLHKDARMRMRCVVRCLHNCHYFLAPLVTSIAPGPVPGTLLSGVPPDVNAIIQPRLSMNA
jgi:hypothetical protein